MVRLYDKGIYLLNGKEIVPEEEANVRFSGKQSFNRSEAKKGTIAYSILQAHNVSGNDEKLSLKFDSLASHDITYVGIIQTAKASGMTHFPIPYILTNCHNSLSAVGGTINEDDHMFGLSSAKKYGGIYVPPHMAVIHQYMREMFAGCGKMILGSDSHTRYGALGTVAIGEGGGELVKQLLGATYDVNMPEVVAVYLEGKPQPFVGPQDIALAIVGAVFANSYVKNKVMEFVGPGVKSMDAEYRCGIDVMTTETTCLSSIWVTDEKTFDYLDNHGRAGDYKHLNPSVIAYYDGCIRIDLSTIKPMIALPFHPSNVYEIDELNSNLSDILATVEKHAAEVSGGRVNYSLLDKIENGKLKVQQGVIAGCAGGSYTNIAEAALLLKGRSCGNDEYTLSVYPASQPVNVFLTLKGFMTDLMQSGAVVRTAFCGPCFGAGDTPCNNGLSVRHSTRNFPNREGSKPGSGQMSAVALMDARSIAATTAAGGILTSAEVFDGWGNVPEYKFYGDVYNNRIFNNFGKSETKAKLIYGPNIKDWPEMSTLSDSILLRVCSKIMDPVTTTDELIPSGETSSYRSNPLGLAEFTLSRRDPEYVGRSKAVFAMENDRCSGKSLFENHPELSSVFDVISGIEGHNVNPYSIEIGSMIYAVKPGDGSAREQAASCQRVLGGLANITSEYATKRYRSNLINWGMLPFQMKEEPSFDVDDYIYVPSVLLALDGNMESIPAYVIKNGNGKGKQITLFIADMTDDEKAIVKAGCLINYNQKLYLGK